jgi:hypothetical protein
VGLFCCCCCCCSFWGGHFDAVTFPPAEVGGRTRGERTAPGCVGRGDPSPSPSTKRAPPPSSSSPLLAVRWEEPLGLSSAAACASSSSARPPPFTVSPPPRGSSSLFSFSGLASSLSESTAAAAAAADCGLSPHVVSVTCDVLDISRVGLHCYATSSGRAAGESVKAQSWRCLQNGGGPAAHARSFSEVTGVISNHNSFDSDFSTIGPSQKFQNFAKHLP